MSFKAFAIVVLVLAVAAVQCQVYQPLQQVWTRNYIDSLDDIQSAHGLVYGRASLPSSSSSYQLTAFNATNGWVVWSINITTWSGIQQFTVASGLAVVSLSTSQGYNITAYDALTGMWLWTKSDSSISQFVIVDMSTVYYRRAYTVVVLTNGNATGMYTCSSTYVSMLVATGSNVVFTCSDKLISLNMTGGVQWWVQMPNSYGSAMVYATMIPNSATWWFIIQGSSTAVSAMWNGTGGAAYLITNPYTYSFQAAGWFMNGTAYNIWFLHAYYPTLSTFTVMGQLNTLVTLNAMCNNDALNSLGSVVNGTLLYVWQAGCAAQYDFSSQTITKMFTMPSAVNSLQSGMLLPGNMQFAVSTSSAIYVFCAVQFVPMNAVLSYRPSVYTVQQNMLFTGTQYYNNGFYQNQVVSFGLAAPAPATPGAAVPFSFNTAGSIVQSILWKTWIYTADNNGNFYAISPVTGLQSWNRSVCSSTSSCSITTFQIYAGVALVWYQTGSSSDLMATFLNVTSMNPTFSAGVDLYSLVSGCSPYSVSASSIMSALSANGWSVYFHASDSCIYEAFLSNSTIRGTDTISNSFRSNIQVSATSIYVASSYYLYRIYPSNLTQNGDGVGDSESSTSSYFVSILLLDDRVYAGTYYGVAYFNTYFVNNWTMASPSGTGSYSRYVYTFYGYIYTGTEYGYSVLYPGFSNGYANGIRLMYNYTFMTTMSAQVPVIDVDGTAVYLGSGIASAFNTLYFNSSAPKWTNNQLGYSTCAGTQFWYGAVYIPCGTRVYFLDEYLGTTWMVSASFVVDNSAGSISRLIAWNSTAFLQLQSDYIVSLPVPMTLYSSPPQPLPPFNPSDVRPTDGAAPADEKKLNVGVIAAVIIIVVVIIVVVVAVIMKKNSAPPQETKGYTQQLDNRPNGSV